MLYPKNTSPLTCVKGEQYHTLSVRQKEIQLRFIFMGKVTLQSHLHELHTFSLCVHNTPSVDTSNFLPHLEWPSITTIIVTN